ncbi:MAG: molecular chaperone [Caldimonas sp.]
MRRFGASRAAAWLLAAFGWAALPAFAGSFSVSPIRIELAPSDRSVVLTIRNDGSELTLVQAELMSWSQVDNDDRLEPTDDLLASPPIFSVAPGTTQLVRIALRRPADAARERAYRVIVSEVLGKPEVGVTGARVALRISLPVFVGAGAAEVSPQIEWSGVRSANGGLALTASNTGAKHLQIRAVDVSSDGTRADARFAGLWYVLPGQRRTMTIPPTEGRAISAGRVRISADTDAGTLAADVDLGPR